jgi:hypothetical protein
LLHSTLSLLILSLMKTRRLLPELQLKVILEQLTVSKRRRALNCMPRNLSDFFGSITDQLRRQPVAKAAQAMSVLQWCLFAEKQLTVQELCHALSVSPGDNQFDPESVRTERSLVDCCLGLVYHDEVTSTVRLIDKSLYQSLNLQYENSQLFHDGHSDIAQTCLTYMRLSGDSMDLNPNADQSVFNQLQNHLSKYPFLKYAVQNWGLHSAKTPSKATHNLAAQIFTQPLPSNCISRGLLHLAYNQDGSGISTLTRNELRMGDSNFGLHVAASFGESRVFELLLQNGNDNLNLPCPVSNMTPLHLASKEGHEDVVCILGQLESIDINPKDHSDDTPLHLASKQGHEDVIHMLLERTDLDINSKNRNDDTPLHLALHPGFGEVVRQLLERNDVDINH